ncbi:hypothetical protein WN55_05895, partial [Dufourea novaeangliae]
PDRNQLSHFNFVRLRKRLQEHGSFNVQKRNCRKIVNDEGCRTSTLAAVAHNPHISTRLILRRILHSDNIYLYHLSKHQKLNGRDFEKRVEFCDCLLHQMKDSNGTFVQTVLWINEATVTNCGLGIASQTNFSLECEDVPRYLHLGVFIEHLMLSYIVRTSYFID